MDDNETPEVPEEFGKLLAFPGVNPAGVPAFPSVLKTVTPPGDPFALASLLSHRIGVLEMGVWNAYTTLEALLENNLTGPYEVLVVSLLQTFRELDIDFISPQPKETPHEA